MRAARSEYRTTDFVISAVGALEQRKGHRYLIEAIGAIAASGKFKCFIAGQGSIHKVLQGEIAVIRSLERIKLLGRIDDPRELLWASDVFAMPSLKEGLGVAALEAMASALPVVASDVGGLREVVEDGRSGIVVPPANAGAIAAAIRRLAESAELRVADERGGAGARRGKLLDGDDGGANARALSRVCEKNTGREGRSRMKSMTGFGRAIAEQDGTRVVAEVRSLNQRFFELKLAVPRGWGEYEAEIRKTVQSVVARGRVEIFIKSVALKPPPVRLEVNDRLANLYVAELRRLGKQLHLNGNPEIGSILNRPEIFHVVEEEHDSGVAFKLGQKALVRALKALDAERVREGRSLHDDFATRVRNIEAAVPKIEKLAEQTRAEIMENFHKRIRELLEELPVNEKRLYEEASSASQHGDISEEITRLRTHLEGLKAILKRKGQVGKSIEFLLQEINREVNTMGSKSQNAALSQVTVEVKAEAEKMREQVQNVE